MVEMAAHAEGIVRKKSCGTCRERRVACDRVAPVCSQCSRLKLACKGYGLRLSWPNPLDKRRSLISKTSSNGRNPYRRASNHIVPVSTRDMEVHYFLSRSSSNSWAGYVRPRLEIPLIWNASEVQLGSRDLFQYFCSDACLSLTTLGHAPEALGRSLVRIALSGNTPSSAAVFLGLLAMSSLHRNGVQTQAGRLKIATIRALNAAMSCSLNAREVIQHAAAGMLLCSMEVYQASCTSSQWTWYITGVKEVLRSPCLKDCSQDSDLRTLLEWVYYHDVMSRFTLRHWHGDLHEIDPKASEMRHKQDAPLIRNTMHLYPSNAAPPMLAVLELLSELTDTLNAKPLNGVSTQETEDYKRYLCVLQWRLRSIAPQNSRANDVSHSQQDLITELYTLSALVYLNRVCSDLLVANERVQSDLDRAFALMSQLESCERQFPLLIIGCEAQTDEQRLQLLDLVSRTEQKKSSRSLNLIKLLVHALWAQNDLAEGRLDYQDKLSSVITRCTIVPSLV